MSDRDSWTTPVHVWDRAIQALRPDRPRYDVDPASNPQSTVRADATCCGLDPEDPYDDGLTFVMGAGQIGWMNPPYSAPGPWVAWAVEQARRQATVCGLMRLAPDTNWWQDHGPTLAWVPRGRIRCVPPPGISESSPRYVMTPCVWTLNAEHRRRWLTAHQGGVLLTRQEDWL